MLCLAVFYLGSTEQLREIVDWEQDELGEIRERKRFERVQRGLERLGRKHLSNIKTTGAGCFKAIVVDWSDSVIFPRKALTNFRYTVLISGVNRSLDLMHP
jgi:hypothetical protein